MNIVKRLLWRLRIAQVVAGQLRSGHPVETRAAYQRLRASRFSAYSSFAMIHAVFEAELASMLTAGRRYDRTAYLRGLDELPAEPSISLRDVRR